MEQFCTIQYFVKAAQSCSRMADLRALTEDVVREMGFDYFALLHHVDLEIARPGLVRLSNYPAGFQERMRQLKYFSDDPVLVTSQKLVRGFCWSEVPELIDLSPRQRAIISLGAREGLGDGYTVPVHVPGEYAGSCSFGVRWGRILPISTLPYLGYIGSFGFEAARRLARGKQQKAAARLTMRQLDCLILAGQGVPARSAAQRLGIKQDTFEKHMADAKQRVGARTTTELVVRSLFEGFIGFDDVLNHAEEPADPS